jgi:hypothetical protein
MQELVTAAQSILAGRRPDRKHAAVKPLLGRWLITAILILLCDTRAFADGKIYIDE